MICRDDRNLVAELLTKFINSSLTNFEFEDKIPESEDSAIWPIISSVWCYYDDSNEHKLEGNSALTEQDKMMFNRWILFLLTDNKYEWPAISYPGIRPLKHNLISKLLGKPFKEKKFIESGDYDFWPFISKESYEDAFNKGS